MPIRRFLWKLAPHLGPRAARWAWDDQFTRGKWDYLAERDEAVAKIVAKHAACGTVVDLGCGEGNLAFELPAGCYSRYVGVDVSRVATNKASNRAQREGNGVCEFVCADLREWGGVEDASVVLIEEALYYLTPNGQSVLLDVCEQSLSPSGAIVILIHDPAKHPLTTHLLIKRYGAHLCEPMSGTRLCFVIPAAVCGARIAA